MRKNWTKNEDTALKKIVVEKGVQDWTAVAITLKSRCLCLTRTGKQCRERWYNHLDPSVNKQVWSMQEEAQLFDLHRKLGNKWKQISLELKGRTDNNIKNRFYSTLRRSLRRLNKVIGEKNSTSQMREIKPSVLTIILNFIYDNQQKTEENNDSFMQELKDLPQLIFQFAEFKPIKENMQKELLEVHKQQIQTIFNLVQQFQEFYQDQKNQKLKEAQLIKSHKQHRHQRIPEDFQKKNISVLVEPEQEKMNLFLNILKEGDRNHFPNERCNESNEKTSGQSSAHKSILESQRINHENHMMMELEEPSPLTCLSNPFPELVVVGKHWSPSKNDRDQEDVHIDEIFQMNYD